MKKPSGEGFITKTTKISWEMLDGELLIIQSLWEVEFYIIL